MSNAPARSAMPVQSGAPQVTLRNAPALAYDGAIAAARTCYAPRVIAAHEVTDRQRETIGKLTFEAGHHTVYQHATFEFGLENVSRHFVWSALHSYPFYNSEQQSQRYVKLGEPRAHVPSELSGEALEIFEAAIVSAWHSYARLSALLKDETFRILKELRHVTPRAQRRSPQGARTRGREEGDRDGALCDSRRRLHGDGPHHLGDHALSPAAHGARVRHAARSERGGRGHGRRRSRPGPVVHRAARRRRPGR